jgi:hypothetical protein
MKPDESAEVKEIPTTELVNVDIQVEQDAGGVVLTLSADDAEEDVSVLLTGPKAREVGDLLFKCSYQIP